MSSLGWRNVLGQRICDEWQKSIKSGWIRSEVWVKTYQKYGLSAKLAHLGVLKYASSTADESDQHSSRSDETD